MVGTRLCRLRDTPAARFCGSVIVEDIGNRLDYVSVALAKEILLLIVQLGRNVIPVTETFCLVRRCQRSGDGASLVLVTSFFQTLRFLMRRKDVSPVPKVLLFQLSPRCAHGEYGSHSSKSICWPIRCFLGLMYLWLISTSSVLRSLAGRLVHNVTSPKGCTPSRGREVAQRLLATRLHNISRPWGCTTSPVHARLHECLLAMKLRSISFPQGAPRRRP